MSYGEREHNYGSSWKSVGKKWIKSVSKSAPEKGKGSFRKAKKLV
jgi:hypothetical protein